MRPGECCRVREAETGEKCRLHLVTGAGASGKSAYAERLAVECPARKRLYVATMKPFGQEAGDRILRHRAMRAQKQFETRECYRDLLQIRIPREDRAQTVILLECLSNLAANEQFDTGGSDEAICERILEGIRHLQKQAGHLIIVTSEVFSDGWDYGEETNRYIRILGKVQMDLAVLADEVTEVVYGIPVAVKGMQDKKQL